MVARKETNGTWTADFTGDNALCAFVTVPLASGYSLFSFVANGIDVIKITLYVIHNHNINYVLALCSPFRNG